MPGNYSHNTIINGTVLDDARYNTDHQNHINNMTPAGVDDYSANTAQMQLTVDPGEVGSESLATSVAGELERIRFAIKEMRGTAQWYETTATKRIIPTMEVVRSDNSTSGWADATTTFYFFYVPIPPDYHSGNMTLEFTRRATVSSGLAVMRRQLFRARAETAIVTLASNDNVDFAPGHTNTVYSTHAATPSQFTTGDYLIWRMDRLGADAGDTLAGTILFDGASVTYTGYAGR